MISMPHSSISSSLTRTSLAEPPLKSLANMSWKFSFIRSKVVLNISVVVLLIFLIISMSCCFALTRSVSCTVRKVYRSSNSLNSSSALGFTGPMASIFVLSSAILVSFASRDGASPSHSGFGSAVKRSNVRLYSDKTRSIIFCRRILISA